MKDWETDQRPFHECLGDWMRLNGLTDYRDAADVLGVRPTTFHGWRYGRRPCTFEKATRRLMTALDRIANGEAA